MHHQLLRFQTGTKLLEPRLEEPLELLPCARAPPPAKELVHLDGKSLPPGLLSAGGGNQNCTLQFRGEQIPAPGPLRFTAHAEVHRPPCPPLQPPLLLLLPCCRPSTGTPLRGQLHKMDNKDDDLEPHFVSCKRGRYQDYCQQLAPHKHSACLDSWTGRQTRSRASTGHLAFYQGHLPLWHRWLGVV